MSINVHPIVLAGLTLNIDLDPYTNLEQGYVSNNIWGPVNTNMLFKWFIDRKDNVPPITKQMLDSSYKLLESINL